MKLAQKLEPYLRAILRAEDLDTARREAILALRLVEPELPSKGKDK